jgi:dihydroneopterin aldolase
VRVALLGTRGVPARYGGFETLAEELALAILEAFDLSRVRIRLRKLHVPVAGFTASPEVEIERRRS